MANLNGAYDPNAEAQKDFAPIPSGKYLAHIVESDMLPTKNNDGEYLELVYEIIDGEYKGRKVWARLNLKNKSEKAQEIGNRQFASVREATGVTSPRDSQDLHYKPHVIRVELIPAGTTQKNGYTTTRDSNEVKAWERAEGAPASSAPTNKPAANTQQSAASAAPPWAQRAA